MVFVVFEDESHYLLLDYDEYIILTVGTSLVLNLSVLVVVLSIIVLFY